MLYKAEKKNTEIIDTASSYVFKRDQWRGRGYLVKSYPTELELGFAIKMNELNLDASIRSLID